MSESKFNVAWLAGLLLLLLAGGCVKNEFEVEVATRDDVSGHFTFLYYASDSRRGWLVEVVKMPENGKLSFVGKTRNPSLVYVFTQGREPKAVFYVERGDKITVSDAGPSPVEWKIKGNAITEGLTTWRLDHQTEVRDGGKSLNAAVAAYVKDHRSDPVSALLLLLYYDRHDDEREFPKLWDSLEGEAARTEWMELAARADLSAGGDFTRLPRQIIINSLENGVDTIVPGRVPAILYFGRNGISRREADVWILRRLSEEWNDSGQRVIAEIGMDADSTARTWPVRHDSLRRAVHGWMPLGLSDSVAISLGVGRVPTFIVLGRKGERLYNGQDRDKAAEIFTSLKKSK